MNRPLVKTLEVRCCCQPQKLRGWLDVYEPLARSGAKLNYPLTRMAPVDAPLHERKPEPFCVTLEVAAFDAFGHSHLALKSEDIPVQYLRAIRGFRENTDDRI